MEKLRETVGRKKQLLDDSSTDNRMAQLALDKTAEEYRQLHMERQQVSKQAVTAPTNRPIHKFGASESDLSYKKTHQSPDRFFHEYTNVMKLQTFQKCSSPKVRTF